MLKMFSIFYWSVVVLSSLNFAGIHGNSYEDRTLDTFKCDDDLLKTIIYKLTMIEESLENQNMNYVKETSTEGPINHETHQQTKQSDCNDKNMNDDCAYYSYNNLEIDPRAGYEEPKTYASKTYPPIPTNTQTSSTSTVTNDRIPSSCSEALHKSGRPNGLHKIQIPQSHLRPFYVYCLEDPKKDGGAWTIIQRRMDGSIDFYRQWSEYQRGFGNLEGEFFLGLEKIHALTLSTMHELWIQLEDFENNQRWAKYSTFALGDSSEGYAMNVLGSYTGDAGDSLRTHAGMKFTTKDVDNDEHGDNTNCAVKYLGAWWYNKCHDCNLNGQYLQGAYTNDQYAHGVDWYTWRDHTYSMKYVHMAIRPLN